MRRKFVALVMAGTLGAVCLTGCTVTNNFVEQKEQEIQEAKENIAENIENIDVDKLNEDMQAAGILLLQRFQRFLREFFSVHALTSMGWWKAVL